MKELNELKYVSTKTGDKGFSKNYSNESIPKTDILFDTLGNIDELNSSIGLSYHYANKYQEDLRIIQKDLQNIMSIIATNVTSKQYQKITQIKEEDIVKLEIIEEQILKKHPLKPVFALPGSDCLKEGAYLDLTRSIARRVERMVLKFKTLNDRDDLDKVSRYLNRLSDLLFLMARSYDK